MLLVLLVGTGLLLFSLLCCGVATDLIVRLVVRLFPEDSADPGFSKSTAVMMLVTLIMLAAHLANIALWALAFVLCGELANFETAFYFSAETYTALGYGDIGLSARWRLLGPLEAINGLLLLGLSTAIMFTVLSRLAAGHLRHQLERRSKQTLEPLSRNQRHAG